MPLDVPLSVQEDEHSCGHHCVSMVAQYYGGPPVAPDDPVFEGLTRADGVLDSFGIANALLRVLGGGGILCASDSITQIIDPDGATSPLPPDASHRLWTLRWSMRAFIMEWVRFREGPERDVGSGVTATEVLPTQGSEALRFPPPYELLHDAVETHGCACVVATDYGVLDPRCGFLHNLVVTAIRPDAVRVNNPGPRPRAMKGQMLPESQFGTAWARADNDLIVVFPTAHAARRFLLDLLDRTLNTAMGMYITMLGDQFWGSIVKTLRASDEAAQLVKQRHDMMLMPWADTATLLREVLMRLRDW